MGSRSPSRTSLAGRYGVASWNPGLYRSEACNCIFTRGRCSVVKDMACIILEKSLKIAISIKIVGFVHTYPGNLSAENGAFQKRSLNGRNLKALSLRLNADCKRFENTAFRN